jgi:hypothetical protein
LVQRLIRKTLAVVFQSIFVDTLGLVIFILIAWQTLQMITQCILFNALHIATKTLCFYGKSTVFQGRMGFCCKPVLQRLAAFAVRLAVAVCIVIHCLPVSSVLPAVRDRNHVVGGLALVNALKVLARRM